MRDIATLKERVEVAERHLKTTEAARNRESEALMDTWQKVRERFNHQEGEIARYRTEVEQLTENNETLSRMVDDLIAIIDGNIERGRDETVPRITTLAEDLLASEPSPEDFAQFAGDAPDETEIAAPERPAPEEAVDLEPVDHDAMAESSADDEEREESGIIEVSAESLSPGIQSLIQRVEGSVGDGAGFASTADADDDDGHGGAEDDEELARELEEIEMLRNELSGLRDRISAGDA